MANPTKIAWTGPTKNVDGSNFTAEQYAGFEAVVTGPGGATQFVLPSAWSPTNEYELPMADLGVGYGTSSVKLRTLAVGGLASDWTAPVSFTLRGPPLPPLNLRAV